MIFFKFLVCKRLSFKFFLLNNALEHTFSCSLESLISASYFPYLVKIIGFKPILTVTDHTRPTACQIKAVKIILNFNTIPKDRQFYH